MQTASTQLKTARIALAATHCHWLPSTATKKTFLKTTINFAKPFIHLRLTLLNTPVFSAFLYPGRGSAKVTTTEPTAPYTKTNFITLTEFVSVRSISVSGRLSVIRTYSHPIPWRTALNLRRQPSSSASLVNRKSTIVNRRRSADFLSSKFFASLQPLLARIKKRLLNTKNLFPSISLALMRRFSIFALVIFAALASRAELLDGINVIVNESVITYDEVERQLEPMAHTVATQHPNDVPGFTAAMASNRTDIIRGKIEAKLVMDEFKTKMNGGDIPESILDDEIRGELRKNFNGDRALMTKTLRERGVTAEMYRDQIRERMIVSYMREKNTSPEKIIISPAKIENYYASHQDQFKLGDQVKLRMITLPKPADSPETARKLGEEIIRKIDGGASFAEMASVYSSDSQRAKGGDRGWIGRDSDIRKELVDATFKLKAGQHSGLIEPSDADSVFIVYAEEVKPAHVKPLTEVRDEIQQKLRTDEQRRLFEKWIARLKNKAFVRLVD